MGCAQSSRPSIDSPLSRLEKMKLQNGYMNGQARRSTGTRKFRQDPAELKRNGHDNGVVRERVVGERKSVGKDGDDQKFPEKVEEVELVDGWPKWLTDNIPREILKDLVPKSSDSYIKIDKVDNLLSF